MVLARQRSIVATQRQAIQDEPRRAILAGLPRCGTTLLSSILGSHPEVHFLSDYLHSFARAQQKLSVRWDGSLSVSERRVVLAMVRDELVRMAQPIRVRVEDFTSIDELHRIVSRQLPTKRVRVSGHKTVLQAREVEALLAQTSITVLVCLRDPRDAAYSYWHRVGEGVEAYLEDWRAMAALSLRGHPRLVVVRFEELASSSQDAIDRVYAQLGLEPHPLPTELAFRRSLMREASWEGNSAIGDGPVDRWKRESNDPIVRYAAATLSEQIARFGYDEGPTIDWRETLRWQLHRRRHGLATQVSTAMLRGAEWLSGRLNKPLRPK
jgi:hypothetical protein